MAIWTRVFIHVSNRMRVYITRGHIAVWIYYTRPYGHVDLLHAAIWPRVIYTRGQLFSTYCQLRGHKDTRLYSCVAIVTAIVNTRRIAAIFVVYICSTKEIDFTK
jgi:hypothetical protein